MKKYLAVSSALMFAATFSVAQSTRDSIVKALTDPKATESAAKADAMLIDHKVIKDSLTYDATIPATKKDSRRFFKHKKKSPKGVQ